MTVHPQRASSASSTGYDLDELLSIMREYFEAERALREQTAQCETEADLFAREQHQIMIEARERLEAWLAAYTR